MTRLKEQYGFPPTVSQRELARRGVIATREQAVETARTLSQSGINVNLAPVVDLDVNPANPAIGALGRSFSADAQVVSEHTRAVIEGHHERGVLTAVKHFPGHGSAAADSHRGFVDVSGTWSEAELDPYRALIHDGMVDMVTALRQAIVAGIDIITFANNNPRAYEPDIAPRAINIIAALVEDGTISEARIDESVGRIRTLKQRLRASR